MKLIFIYGPPAVGKLTVAEELGRLTNFVVWDNHRSLDAVLPLFAFGTPSLNRLVEQIRVSVLQEAAREGVDAIFTFVYAHPLDTAHVERIAGAVEREGGDVCFVQLLCTPETQDLRVMAEDRARRQKLRSAEVIRQMREDYDLVTPIPGRETLSIDTTHLPPAETAARIAAHYRLARAAE